MEASSEWRVESPAFLLFGNPLPIRYSLLAIHPIAALTRAAWSGRSRMRLPVALATALATAATAGADAPSPQPSRRPLGRRIHSTSTFGTSGLVRIGELCP